MLQRSPLHVAPARWSRAGASAIFLGVALTGCVIRTGAVAPEDPAAPEVEQFASAGEALDKVSTAGLMSLGDIKRSQQAAVEQLEDVSGRISGGDDDALLAHQRDRLTLVLAFYDQIVPLYEALGKAPAERRPGITAEIYEAQRRYLEDESALDRRLDLPSAVPAPAAALPVSTSLEEGDLADEIELDEAEVLSLFQAGSYAELVATVAEAGAKREALSPEGRAAYALALGYQGVWAEAARETQALAGSPLVSPNVTDARLSAAVYFLAQGQGGAAESALRALIADASTATLSLGAADRVARGMLDELGRGIKDPDLVSARMAIEQEHFPVARERLAKVLAGTATADVKSRAEALQSQVASAEDRAFDRRISQVREMAALPTQHQAAAVALTQIEADFPDVRFKARIAAVRAELEGTGTSQDVDYQARLTSASDLVAAKKYELAVVEYEGLYGTPVAAEARTGRERAVDLYVQQVREEVARDYIAAKRISDPQKRLAALDAVYKRMETVSQKYPESRMTPKLVSHMQVVAAEIVKIDPNWFGPPAAPPETPPADAPQL